MIFGVSCIIIGSISLLGGYSYFNRRICQNNDSEDNNNENSKLTKNNINYNTIQDVIEEDVEEDVEEVETISNKVKKNLKYSNIVTKHPYNSYWT